MADKLSSLNWIQAGFRALTRDGHHAIKAEVIARDLGVSKGSFYWHFENVPAFKQAMLVHWVEMGTETIMQEVADRDADPESQLRLLIKNVSTRINMPYGGLLAEAAIRDWARFDPRVLETVRRVDQTRLKFLATLFRRIGATTAISRQMAGLLYGGLLGLEYLSHERLASLKTDLSALLEVILVSLKTKENR